MRLGQMFVLRDNMKSKRINSHCSVSSWQFKCTVRQNMKFPAVISELNNSVI